MKWQNMRLCSVNMNDRDHNSDSHETLRERTELCRIPRIRVFCRQVMHTLGMFYKQKKSKRPLYCMMYYVCQLQLQFSSACPNCCNMLSNMLSDLNFADYGMLVNNRCVYVTYFWWLWLWRKCFWTSLACLKPSSFGTVRKHTSVIHSMAAWPWHRCSCVINLS